MRKIHFKRILAMLLAAIMLLQDTQDLLVYAADFASNVPRYVNFSAPDALEDVTDVISVEEEQEPLDETEKDALVEEQTGTEQTETVTETESTEVVEEGELREPELEESEPQPGEVVSFTEESITYALGDGNYRTVFSANVGTYVDEQGNVQLEDNTLQEVASFSEEGVDVYTNTANDYQVVIPETMSEDLGMLLEQDGYALEVIPVGGDYTKSVVKENAILYNDVYENIDVQYTVQGNSIKEDIILRERTDQNTFSYIIRAEGLQAAIDGQTVILSDSEGNPVFALLSPFMSDANGEVSFAVIPSLSEDNGETILTITADAEWLSDENRTYPVKIDPSQIYVEPAKIGLYCVEEGSPNTVIGDNNYPYVGYDDGIKSRNLAAYGTAHKKCRTYIGIDYDFAALGEDAIISSATLRISQASHMSGGGIDMGLFTVEEAWNPRTITWNKQKDMVHTSLDVQQTTASANVWIEYNITDYVNNLAQGIAESEGLVLKYLDENKQCEILHNNSSVNYGPQIVVDWGENGDDPALAEMALDDLTINVRPISEKNIYNNGLNFDGVFADGLATADATVKYSLTNKGSGETTALTLYAYPNSLEFVPGFPNGTRYKSLESNWQSDLYSGLSINTVYQFTATAEKDGESSSPKYSDTFVIYRANSFDTFPKIAAYYGVNLSTILRDNRVQDVLIVAGNTIFVRNPGTTVPYVSSGLTEEEMRLIDGALLGRGQYCEFGFEPVNLNTGNFYMNQQDVSIPDIGADFAINRNYNSIGAKLNSVFGYGWTFDYDEFLSMNSDGTILYKRGDGSYLYMTKGADGNYHAPAGYEYTLSQSYQNGLVSGWKLTAGDYTVKNFDTYGMLRSVTDRQGNTTTVSYDGNWHISGLTSPSGKTYRFTTDAEGRITTIALPNGAVLKYTYDANGDLTSYTNANGNVIRYEYDSNHYMLRWYDANGNCVVDNRYDGSGRVVAQTDAEGNTATLSYSDGKTVTTDNNGNTTTYYYNENKYTTKIVYPDGSTETKTYTADNYLATETDKAGNTTSYTYDDRGNLLTTTRADGAVSRNTYDAKNQLLTATDYNGNTTTYTYDAKGNLTAVTYADGTTEYYAYDSKNRLIELTDGNGVKQTYTYSGAMPATYTNGEGNTTTYSYNAMNLVVEEKDALGSRIVHVYDSEGRETQTVAADGGSTTYQFDAAGNVLSITDARGKKTIFTYDSLGHILSGTDPLGQKLVYTYDKNYNKTSEIDALGGKATYTYDALNRVTSETDANGNKTTYQYDKLGNLIKVTNVAGQSTSYTYDTVKGVLTSETDANGHTTTYAYDANGNLTKTTYADGGVETYTYDARNRVATSTSVLGLKTTYSYDGAGNITQSKNSLGEVTAYQYNGNNQVTAITNALSQTEYYGYDAAGRLASYTDGNGAKETYAYDAVSNLIKTVDANGGVTTTTYDLNGNVTSVTDANGNKTTYTYDAINQLTSETKANGAITAYVYDKLQRPIKVVDALNGETVYTYDAVGNLLTTTDANGNKYTYTYDKAYRVTKITLPDESTNTMSYDAVGNVTETTDAAGLKTSYTYDACSRVVAQSDNTGMADAYVLDHAGNVVKQTDALGRVTTYTYDVKGRQTSITDADGSVTSYAYNAVDELIQVTDAMGNVTAFAYDAAGNNISMSQSEDKVYTYAYDKLHNLVSETDPLGGTTTYTYDAVGNLLKLTTADGVVNSYTYDKVYNIVSETDGNGNTTYCEYDALNRLTLKTDTLGNTTEYRYDAIGNLTKYKDENGHITEYRYDSMSNMVKTISPLRAVTKYTYDAHGNATSQTDALGNVTYYQYDLNNNVTKQTQADGGVYTYKYDAVGRLICTTTPLDYQVEMTYDKVDNLIKETDSLGRVTSYEYDRLHHMTKSVDAEGGVSVYSYDAYGNLTSEADPLGRTTTYTYDLCDRMTEMYDPLQQVTSISYDPVGNVTDITTPGGRTIAYSYDGNYNQTSVTDPMGYVTGYIYDKRNQLTSEIDALSNANSYAYDAVGQLVSYTDRRGNTERYTYDAHGNQLSYKDMAGKVTQYSYDLNNNLTKVEDANGGKTYYEYDSMNRMTAYTNALGETTQYTYDYMGNQTSIINADGRVETNIYDEAGRLVLYVKNSKKSIKYDYDALNDLVEKSYYNSTGKESEEAVIYGYNANGERVSMMDLTGDSTYEYDALGRITKVTNGAGKTVTYKYDEADNLIELGYPDGTSVLYTYDLNNNITSVTEPDGDCTTYTYDALNRVTATIRPDFTATYMTYDEESNLTVLKNVCTHCDEILSEYHYTYNEMGYVVTEEVTERVSVYCGKYHGDKEHGNFWRGKGHEYCQHEWFQYDDKGIAERLEEVNALVEETSLVVSASHGTARRGGRWFSNPAYLYCTCHTKLVTTSKSYVYDDNWQILSCTTEVAGEQAVKECYAYDEAGNRTSYERWSGLTKVESIRYEYNSSNQLTATYEQEGYDWFNTEKTLYTYDADGNLIKEEVEYRKYHDDDWYDDKHDDWWDNWFDDWFDWFGTDAVASAEAGTNTEEAQESEGTSLFNFGLGNQGNDNDHDKYPDKPTYDSTYTTTTYAYDNENRLKAVREQGVLLQAMTYDGDGNLAYELDYNVDAVVDGRCIYFPTHGTKAERELYKNVCDGYGWVRGDYTLTEYLNDVTQENTQVLAEYGRNYCSMTVYTYGNERISATTFSGYGYHFGCHDSGYHNIYTQYEKWHDRWQIKDRWDNSNHNNGQGNRPRTTEASYNYSNTDKFKATYGSYSSYHSGKYCGHKWKTSMSKIYYLYDGHGSVERVHGKDGSTFRLEYDTYGNLVAGIVEKWHVWYNDIFAHRTANIYAYSGERYNVISGLQFLRARWYDTDTGRFISEDSYLGTQENPLSRNRYIYTANNPVNYIDPSGHILLSTGLIIGATIAAGVVSGIYSGVKKAQETNDVKKGIVEGVAVGLATAAYTGLMLATPLSVGGILGAGAASGGIYSYAEMGMSTLLGTKEYSAAEWSYKPYVDGFKGALGAGFDLVTDKLMGKVGGAILGSKPAKAAINFLSDTKLGKYAIGAWNGAAQFLDDMMSGAANASQRPGCALLEDTSNGTSNPVSEVTENLIDNLDDNFDNPKADFYAGEKGVASSLEEYDAYVKGASGVKYSPVNPGPLSEDVANSFNGATYTERVLTEDTVMYRVSGGNAKEVGSYMSMTPQGGGLQSQLDLALNPAWGNTTENVTKVVVPKGTTIYEGIAAPQNIYDSLGNVIGTLPGGGNQVYIPTVEAGWFQ